ncbi:MAG: sugar transporter ATP-binding protein [Nocardioides sp.]|nr:sugar transporter ATP-binding protein [Nocardioides sp.]
MSSVTYEGATRTFPGQPRPAVDSLDLEIAQGELLVLVGPSGCGKSTSLRMLAGLEDLSSGRIMIGDRDITHVEPKARDIAMVFQNYALYPHMTVGENMGFALKVARVSRSEIVRRVQEAAVMLDLTDLLERRPKALSGGQRQRVAMGRAIVRSPQVFLMDEPLSNLDAKLRVQTRAQIAQLQRNLDATMVYVTHDQVEAMTLGDRVAVLRDGILQQCDTPRRIYDRPANVFVAGFLGSPAMNLFDLKLVDGGAQFNDVIVPITRSVLDQVDDATVTLGIRPEDVIVDATGIPLVVDVVEELGADAYAYGHVELNGSPVPLVARVDWRTPPEFGETLHVRLDGSRTHLFSAHDGSRLAQPLG